MLLTANSTLFYDANPYRPQFRVPLKKSAQVADPLP